jgi:hypothetical protein
MSDFSDAPSLRESPRLRLDPSQWGPVRHLCDEINFPFDKRLERWEVLVAFVRGLIAEVSVERDMAERITKYAGKPPSEGSAEVLALADDMLAAETAAEAVSRSKVVHDACWRLNPDEAHPTDHLIDMLSSCASAIRFGLEAPCHSRHAAAAADHVWKHLYGVSRFDSHTPAWQHDWARKNLLSAIIGLLPQSEASESNRKDGSSPQNQGAA